MGIYAPLPHSMATIINIRPAYQEIKRGAEFN